MSITTLMAKTYNIFNKKVTVITPQLPCSLENK